MGVLNLKAILEDQITTDPNSITALTLALKALSDVSYLSDFKNLKRLDLSMNNLVSLEGLRACGNLKWLSVVENKLQSLKGVEGLTKLTVLNAGKNKLTSIDEVRSLVSLRALILNDNKIALICRLDQLKELNTLVLSRNPISKIGESLSKNKGITKLSLSNCQIECIESSLKSCTELRELRLAHNYIKALPSELARNIKLQNLDIGNNMIAKWSGLKVLSSLVNLKNLNLQGNPVSGKESFPEEIRKVLPNLQILNGKPLNKVGKKNHKNLDELAANVDPELNQVQERRNLKNQHRSDESEGDYPSYSSDLETKDSRSKSQKKTKVSKEEASDPSKKKPISEKKMNRDSKGKAESANGKRDIAGEKYVASDSLKGSMKKRKISNDLMMEKSSDLKVKMLKRNGEKKDTVADAGEVNARSKQRKNDLLPKNKASSAAMASTISKEELSRKLEKNDFSIIDDGETPFSDILGADYSKGLVKNQEKEVNQNPALDDAVAGLVIFPTKEKKKKKKTVGPAALQLLEAGEIGLGGPSTWDG